MVTRILWAPLAILGLLFACTNADHPQRPLSTATGTDGRPSIGDLEIRLRESVIYLAGTIGERNLSQPKKLQEASDWIVAQWKSQGLDPKLLTYTAADGQACSNIEVTVTQHREGPVVVVGAHYDSAIDSPGADDNASGVAAMLEISRAIAGQDLGFTVRCVAFVNEEPPYFNTFDMGSLVYAKLIYDRGDSVKHMLSIESIGFFSDAPDSQDYPPPLSESYPNTGNFIGVVGDADHETSVLHIAELLRESKTIPIESAALPIDLPGVTWSDHASFWRGIVKSCVS